MALSKHADETADNKAKLKEIIDRWSRIITGSHQHSRKAVMVSGSLPSSLFVSEREERNRSLALLASML